MLEYKATAIGAGRNTVMEFFEKEYKEDIGFEDAIILGLVAMGKAIESELSVEGIEMGVVRVEDRKFRLLEDEEKEKYIDKANEIIRQQLK